MGWYEQADIRSRVCGVLGLLTFPQLVEFLFLYEQADIRSRVCMSWRHGPDLGLYGRLWKRRWKHLANTRNDKLPRAGVAS